MAASTFLSLGAFLALVPATAAAFHRLSTRALPFWAFTALAAGAPLAWTYLQLRTAWDAGFAMSLWLSVAATTLLFALLSAVWPETRRLAPLLFPYLLLHGVLATVWSAAPGTPIASGAPSAWLAAHIAVALAAYGLVTLAAVAAAAVAVQELAVKSKRPSAFSAILPSVRDGERLQLWFLVGGELVLGIGLLTGMAVEFLTEARLLRIDHKTLFVLATFLIIAALLYVHMRSGLRGRAAARWVLVAYLLLMLGYPGTKFVTDVLVS